jgi:hypothetical protein
MKIEKLQSMRVASNPVTLAFGLFPLGLVPINLPQQREAHGGNSVGQLGLDGKQKAH